MSILNDTPILTDDAEINPRSPAIAASSPTPQWASVFEQALGAAPGGYAYAIALNGTIVETGHHGFTRMPEDGVANWSVDSRCNLASVSKTVTATAIMHLVEQNLITSVNDCFWPYVQPLLPNIKPASGVETVTIEELLNMSSRLVKNGTLNTKLGVLTFLGEYLSQNPIIPRQLGVYSNTNFTILQAVVEHLAQEKKHYQGYVEYVHKEILGPMGVDNNVFSPVPDPPEVATLAYESVLDPPFPPGKYWPQVNCVGPGGWVASARAVAHYMIGLRKNTVLSVPVTEFMLNHILGWYHAGTCWGVGYHHNGGLTTNAGSGQPAGGISTGVVAFPEGYDAVLLVNKHVPNIIALMVQAFEAG